MEHVPTGLGIGLKSSKRKSFERSADSTIFEESQVSKDVVKVDIGVGKKGTMDVIRRRLLKKMKMCRSEEE